MAPPKEASQSVQSGHFQLTLLSLFDHKICYPAYEALFIPLLSPTFFPLAEFARIYTTPFYEQNGIRTAISVASCHMQNIIIGLVVPGLLQPEGDGRLLAFPYPIVSQDEVAPTSKVQPPRLTMISYIPLASRSTSSRSSSFVESSKSFVHSKGLEPLHRQRYRHPHCS